MKQQNFTLYLVLLLLVGAVWNTVPAATTGKIAGKVTDKETGEPLAGANVMIEGTNYGAAADMNGDYFIINIPPGRYNVVASMIGYGRTKMEKVLVSVNSTTNLNFELSMETIEGQEVVVTASPISFKKDQTSSVRNVSADQIEVLPIQNMQQVVEMQAGVVNGHFRGGRLNEVSYLIDGVQVDESFGGVGSTATIENDVIKDLEVITGTFNAEYGRAMSGIVNAVTKDGGQGFHGSVTGMLGNYYTPNTDLFIGLKPGQVARNQDYKFQLEGPIIPKLLSFFVNVRYQNNKNHLNAIRRFEMDDYSNYSFDDPALWIDIHNGDSSYVPLNSSINRSIFGKLSLRPIPGLKLALVYSNNDDDWGSYSHNYKYAPDGKARTYRKNNLISFQLNHTISPRIFHELKLSYTDYYRGNYLYENPLDPRYIHDIYTGGGGPGFRTGGQDKGHSERYNKDMTVKYDFTWQVHKHHSLKLGALGITHEIDNNYHSIQNKYKNESNVYDNYYDVEKNTYVYPNYAPEIFGDSSLYAEEYVVKPSEFAAYFQDKMEFDEMVINMGVRFDYFDPNTTYPSNRRNPANQLSYPEKPKQMSEKLDADPKYQLSPRFGLSYQLSNTALLRFSYGHFFQVPPMYAMYANNSQLVAPTDYATQSGNPQLEPEKTVKYEVGLWQELMKDMGLEVTLFYQDIYDLLSMKVISTYNQIQYGLYTNKDYGNSKGLEVKYDIKYDNFAAMLNYTLQYTRGNADNPTMTFTRAGNSMDPIARLIPMSWDQRHTLNLTLSYVVRNFNATLTGYFNSGSPYTWVPIAESRLSKVNLYPNNSKKPITYTLDFYSYYDYKLNDTYKLRFSLLVENLLDRKNELWVNGNTGHANEAIIRPTDLASHRSLFNDYEDRIINPAAIAAPRYVKFGIGFMF